FVVDGFVPKSTSVWVPVLLAVQVCFTLGASLVTSAVVVHLRDIRHALPILLQIGVFATPVAYGVETLPHWLCLPFTCLNPLVGVIDGYRRTVLFGKAPRADLLGVAALRAVLFLIGGAAPVTRHEPGGSDA